MDNRVTLLSQDVDRAIEQLKGIQTDMLTLAEHNAKPNPLTISSMVEVVIDYLSNSDYCIEDSLQEQVQELEAEVGRLNDELDLHKPILDDSWNEEEEEEDDECQ